MAPRNVAYVKAQRKALSESWGSDNREDLLETIDSIANRGHSYSFDHDVALFKSLSAAQQKEIIKKEEIFMNI